MTSKQAEPPGKLVALQGTGLEEVTSRIMAIIRMALDQSPGPLTSRLAVNFTQDPGCFKYSSPYPPGPSSVIGWDQKEGETFC